MDKRREEEALSVTMAAIQATLPALAERNAIRAANEADRSLAAVSRRKRPLPVGTWTEYKQAYSVLRLATGQDSSEAAQVQVNIWGRPPQQQPTQDARNVTATVIDCPEE